MNGPEWQIVVLNWNGREDTLACLESLSRIDRPDVAVICVDNGSGDGSVPAVRERFPQVTVMEAGDNLGYAGGNNLGLEHAMSHGARWMVLVNNDATVAPDVIDGFAAVAAAHPRSGILAGKVYEADRPQTVAFAGQRVNTRLGYSGRPRGHGRPDGPRYASVQPTDRAVGALMAISREAINAVGLLDEGLFAYVEDIDWALRVRSAGFAILLAPQARAWHQASSSTGGARSTQTLYYGVRNTIAVLERRRPLGRAAARLRRLVILATFALHAARRPDRGAALAAVREGWADARRGRTGIRPQRAASAS